MFSRDLVYDPTPNLGLDLTVKTLAKLKSTKPLSCLPCGKIKMVKITEYAQSQTIHSVVAQ